MNIIPWLSKREQNLSPASPEASLSRLRGEMDRLFDRFFTDPWGGLESFGGQSLMGPRLDMSETENDVTIKAELPGVDPKEVDVRVQGNVLSIRGEKKLDHEEKRRDYQYVERQYGAFHRSVPLPPSVDPDKVDASFKDGVLTLTVAKRPDAKVKKIEVKAG